MPCWAAGAAHREQVITVQALHMGSHFHDPGCNGACGQGVDAQGDGCDAGTHKKGLRYFDIAPAASTCCRKQRPSPDCTEGNAEGVLDRVAAGALTWRAAPADLHTRGAGGRKHTG